MSENDQPDKEKKDPFIEDIKSGQLYKEMEVLKPEEEKEGKNEVKEKKESHK